MLTDKINTISTIMSNNIITVRPVALLREIHEIFKTNNIHHIPVVDEKMMLAGIVSYNDYAQALHSFTKLNSQKNDLYNEKNFDAIMAKDIMSKNPIALSPLDKIGTAVGIFKKNLFHAIPITQDGKLVGLITTFDLLTHAYSDPIFVK